MAVADEAGDGLTRAAEWNTAMPHTGREGGRG